MLKNVKQKDKIEFSSQPWISVVDVVAIDGAPAAYVLFERYLIEVKTCDFAVVGVFDLQLKQAVTATNFSDLSRVSD